MNIHHAELWHSLLSQVAAEICKFWRDTDCAGRCEDQAGQAASPGEVRKQRKSGRGQGWREDNQVRPQRWAGKDGGLHRPRPAGLDLGEGSEAGAEEQDPDPTQQSACHPESRVSRPRASRAPSQSHCRAPHPPAWSQPSQWSPSPWGEHHALPGDRSAPAPLSSLHLWQGTRWHGPSPCCGRVGQPQHWQ